MGISFTKTLFVTLLFAVLLAGTTIGPAAAGEMPATDGKAFWEYVTKTNPYTGWGYFPDRYGTYVGTQPHGAHLKLYVNGPALNALRAGKPMPEGAIVLKENYGKDGKTLMAVTPMYKARGYNPDGGDWFWAKYKADGTVEKAGKVDGCINCHKARAGMDWIFNEVK